MGLTVPILNGVLNIKAFDFSKAFSISTTMGTFTVYILFSESTDKFYIGHTSNIKNRLNQHNDSFVATRSSKFTLKNGPWKLVYTETGFPTRADAMKREKSIKGWKSRVMIKKLIDSAAIENH